MRLGRLYFGNAIGEAVGTIQPWPADEEVLIETPPAHDPDIKRSALASPSARISTSRRRRRAPVPAMPTPPMPVGRAGETVAAKGEVTGAGKRPKTPAERLGLDAKQRAKSEKCLAEAVYFESRGEVKRGQIAVAQVVMNRVFSGFYPNNVCGVVYQNAHRKLACQFTFACDGIPDVVDEPDMWEQAKEIARDMLDGKLWLPEIGHSTHYHAYWVHPSWVERDAEALQDRRAQLLPAARLGRHRRGAEPVAVRARRAEMRRRHVSVTSRYRARRPAPAPNASARRTRHSRRRSRRSPRCCRA